MAMNPVSVGGWLWMHGPVNGDSVCVDPACILLLQELPQCAAECVAHMSGSHARSNTGIQPRRAVCSHHLSADMCLAAWSRPFVWAQEGPADGLCNCA